MATGLLCAACAARLSNRPAPPLVIDLEAWLVELDGKRVTLPNRQLRLLEVLVKAGGRLVPREALKVAAGIGPEVDATTLNVSISRLRKVLSSTQVRIENVSKAGYRLAGTYVRGRLE